MSKTAAGMGAGRRKRLPRLLIWAAPADARLAAQALRQSRLAFRAKRVESSDDFIAALEAFAPDVLLCDYNTLGLEGMSALKRARASNPALPILVVAEALDFQAAVRLVSSGIEDYVLKDEPVRLGFAVQRALLRSAEHQKLRLAERELAAQVAVLQAEHETFPDGAFVLDPEQKILSYNQRFVQMWGIPPAVVASGSDRKMLEAVFDRVVNSDSFMTRVYHAEDTRGDEVALKDGRIFERYSAPLLHGDQREPRPGQVWFFRDVTERKHAEHLLRERANQLAASEMRFRLLMDNAPDAVLLYDPVGDRIVEANRSAERLFECSREQLFSLGLRHFFAPAQAGELANDDSFFSRNARAAAGETVEFEHRIIGEKHTERLVEVKLVVLPLADGQLLRASFVDVTEQRKLERALKRVNRTLMTLGATNAALVRTTSEEALLKAMCGVAVDAGGYALAWVGYAESDAAKTVRCVASAGTGTDYVTSSTFAWSDTRDGRGPTGTAIRTGKTTVNRDSERNPRLAPWREAARKHGFKSTIAIPLRGPAGTFGALSLYATETDAFDEAEVKLLEELGADLSYGINALRDRAARDSFERRTYESMQETVAALAGMAELRDPYTAGHQEHVAALASAIAGSMGLPEERIRGLAIASLIHDIGKIQVPAEILSKPGKLSRNELEIIRFHVQAAYDVLKHIHFPWPVAQIVLQHHERLDGSGYPNAIAGEAILTEAKILAVADVVESMMLLRPYRAALGIDAALEEIEQGKGRLYDPTAVDACVALFRKQGFKFVPAGEWSHDVHAI